jgi:two-component system cell cycle sensor histidine kinase/response regulator CckA
MRNPKNLKFKYKLIAIILSSTIIALTVAFTGAVIYNRITIQEYYLDHSRMSASVIGNFMIGALSFGGQGEALEDLDRFMKATPEIENVVVYNDKDEVFAQYPEPTTSPLKVPSVDKVEGTQFKDGYLHIYNSIYFKHKRYGAIYLRVSTEDLNKRLQNLIFSMVVIVLLLIPISFILASRLQGIISKPILDLVKVNNEVSSQGNYSIRVRKVSNDEVGMLYDSFNDMMEQIHNRDIQRDEVENELKAAEFFLTSVMESMPSSLITIDRGGIVTHWNNSAVKLTGIEAVDAKGTNLWELLPDFKKYKDVINNVFQTKKTIQLYKELIKISGISFYLNIIIFPLLDTPAPKFVLMINNVTDLEIKEQQLRQSQKMETVGTLAGGLAHDFNNVLGGIIGTISLFKYKTSQNREITRKDIEKYFTTIEESAGRASDMVQHLLSLTRKQELSFAPIDLNSIIESTVKICKNTFDKSIEINAWYVEEKAMANADFTQIEQCLLNLYINAFHAMTIMKKEGDKFGGNLNIFLEKVQADKYLFKLHTEVNPEEYYWRISVQDTGVGMDTQTLGKIFDPFFTTKGEGKGTGLGLAMVYNIIKQHNGFIDVYSQEGAGSTFHVYLPVLRSKFIKKSSRFKKVKIHRGKGLILVIDDEQVMRQTAKSILEECGYDVIVAGDGEEGVEMYKQYRNEIKAVVLDMVMPRMSGEQAFIELSKINKEVKVLLASGFKQDNRVESILERGVKGFIQKPYGLVNLANSIHHVINNK